jgi:hypothetical protein
MSYQDEQQRILDAHAALVAAKILLPVCDARSEARLWLDCERASFVTNLKPKSAAASNPSPSASP